MAPISEQPTRILLVDDYPDALEMWGLYLRHQGYDVTTAINGPDALATAASTLPHLIVMDLELPGLTGFEVARRLRASPDTAGIRLIAATGYSSDRQLDEARQCGFDAILIKPCEPASIVREIERLLRHQTA